MKRSGMRTFINLGAAALLAGGAALCSAAVSNSTATVSTKPGAFFLVPMQLTADQAVAGVNGELSYDTTKFDTPSIVTVPETGSFVVLGNSPVDGKERFVVYSDPTAALPIGPINFYIKLHAKNLAPIHPTETLTYTMAAASTPEAVSIAGVHFNDVTVNTNQSSAKTWAIYE